MKLINIAFLLLFCSVISQASKIDLGGSGGDAGGDVVGTPPTIANELAIFTDASGLLIDGGTGITVGISGELIHATGFLFSAPNVTLGDGTGQIFLNLVGGVIDIKRPTNRSQCIGEDCMNPAHTFIESDCFGTQCFDSTVGQLEPTSESVAFGPFAGFNMRGGFGNSFFGSGSGRNLGQNASGNIRFNQCSGLNSCAVTTGSGIFKRNTVNGADAGNAFDLVQDVILLGYNAECSGSGCQFEWIVGSSSSPMKSAWFGQGAAPQNAPDAIVYNITPDNAPDAVQANSWTHRGAAKVAGTGQGGDYEAGGGTSSGGFPGSFRFLTQYGSVVQVVALTVDDQAITPISNILVLSSDSASATSRSVLIQDGLVDGMELTIVFNDPSDAMEIQDSGNHCLGGTFSPNDQDTLKLVWIAATSCWHETGGSAN